MRFLVFIAIALSVLGGMHYYVWLRLVRDTGLPRGMRLALTVLLLLLLVSIPVVLFVRRQVDVATSQTMLVPFRFWLGFIVVCFVFVLGADIARWIVILVGKLSSSGSGGAEQAADPARRVFLSRIFAGAAAGGALVSGVLSVRGAMSNVRIKRLEVTLARLPAALDGLRIAQLSDLHIGPTLGRDWLSGIVERTNALSADLICITGDLVDGSVSKLEKDVEPLGKLSAKQGVYFVTGNHEYYSGAESWCRHVTSLGIKVLRNERVEIRRGDAALDLAGIDDRSAFGAGHGPDIDRACAGRDASRELVLLAHQPRQIEDAVRHGVGLQLSGHTHGGQIWPWHYAVYLQQPYLKGLHARGETQIYISEGTGFWGPPLRFGSTAEITEITLRAPSAKKTG
ncbi:MAG: metallophosphoesterase [Myxococcales bacterium]|nr:metallophosphoesterase [Myxococcales bacterium]